MRYEQLREQMGLDDPLVVRYLRWMGLWTETDGKTFNGLIQGNFGYSEFFKRDVIEAIKDPMSNTIFINIFSTIAALGITIPLGIYCAVHKGKRFDKTTQVVTMLGYSLPVYIIALVFMFFFCWKLMSSDTGKNCSIYSSTFLSVSLICCNRSIPFPSSAI